MGGQNIQSRLNGCFRLSDSCFALITMASWQCRNLHQLKDYEHRRPRGDLVTMGARLRDGNTEKVGKLTNFEAG